MNSAAQRKQQLIDEGALKRLALVAAAHGLRDELRPAQLVRGVSGNLLRTALSVLSTLLLKGGWQALLPSLLPLLGRVLPVLRAIMQKKSGLSSMLMALITTGLTSGLVQIFRRKKDEHKDLQKSEQK